MVPHPRRFVLAAGFSLLAGAASPASAQTPALHDYTGTYRYHGRATLALVPGDSLLYAVISSRAVILIHPGLTNHAGSPGRLLPIAIGWIDVPGRPPCPAATILPLRKNRDPVPSPAAAPLPRA